MLYEKDFVLRLIRQLAQFLGKLLRLKRDGDLDEALEEIRKSARDLLGLEWDILGSVDAATAVELLGDPRKVEVLARLVAEEAEVRSLKGDATAARASARQALDLWEAARAGERGASPPLDEGTPAVMERMEALLG